METTFDGFGRDSTLICGPHHPCSFIKLGVPLDDPDLCILCAFPGSCLVVDDFGSFVFAGTGYEWARGNPQPTTVGKGCGASDIARLCDFYADKYWMFDFDFALDGGGRNDCNGRALRVPILNLILNLKVCFVIIAILQYMCLGRGGIRTRAKDMGTLLRDLICICHQRRRRF